MAARLVGGDGMVVMMLCGADDMMMMMLIILVMMIVMWPLLLGIVSTPVIDRLVGLVVRRPPRERKIAGSNPACARSFWGGRVIPVT